MTVRKNQTKKHVFVTQNSGLTSSQMMMQFTQAAKEQARMLQLTLVYEVSNPHKMVHKEAV